MVARVSVGVRCGVQPAAAQLLAGQGLPDVDLVPAEEPAEFVALSLPGGDPAGAKVPSVHPTGGGCWC